MAIEKIADTTADTIDSKLRKYPRRKINKVIGLLYRGDYVRVQGIDLSEGGMSFEAAETIPENASVVLSVQVPGGDFIITRATINRVRESSTSSIVGYGVAFENLKLQYRRMIREFISAKSEAEVLQDS